MTATVETPAGLPAPEVSPESDFLFHLYRGSELLHDSRLIEARSELEAALELRPLDARTQGLLAGVYFRTGHYELAVTTYRNLLREHPKDPTLRLNLALCYLKTGDSQAARALLEALVIDDISDARAWGYLAVALERLGYLDQAQEAFERAGQPDLALRIAARGAPRPKRPRPDTQAPPEEDALDKVYLATRRGTGVRHQTFEELDAGALDVELVRRVPTENHAREELTDATLVSPSLVSLVPSFGPRNLETSTVEGLARASVTPPLASGAPGIWRDAPTLATFLDSARLEQRKDTHCVKLLGTRLARIDVCVREGHEDVATGFAFRLEALRSYTGSLDGDILQRQIRPLTTPPPPHGGEESTRRSPLETGGETFGGIGTPFGTLREPGQLWLAPKPSLRLEAFRLENDAVFFREEALVGFDLSLAYENGRLGAFGLSGDASPVVQLRGSGTLLLELASELLVFDVLDGQGGGATVRKEVVVGWMGRLLPRLLSAGEAPCGQRGLVGFSGEGTVLVIAK